MASASQTEGCIETEADFVRAFCKANNIDFCEIHGCEYTYSPHGYACAPCGWATQAILDLVEASGLEWEEARDQYDEGYRTCEFCGYCKGNCPWSLMCPECGAKPGVGMGQCRDSEAGGRLVKLHAARWEAVSGL